jgi:hypothetical protein
LGRGGGAVPSQPGSRIHMALLSSSNNSSSSSRSGGGSNSGGSSHALTACSPTASAAEDAAGIAPLLPEARHRPIGTGPGACMQQHACSVVIGAAI